MRIISYILTLALVLVTGTFLFEQEPIEVESEIITAENTKPTIIPALESEIICLAKNIYFEARGESIAGQTAVASVTLNRVKSPKFPNTVCEVVHQAKYSKWWKETHNRDVPIKNKCQFSWYCDGKSDKVHDHNAYKKIYRLASYLYNADIDNTSGAIYYHANYVSPYWSEHMTIVSVADTHIFYKD